MEVSRELKIQLGLDEDEVYRQSFLLAMEAPFALDPITHTPKPFKFKDRESMLRVAKTAIGMPYVEIPGSKFHVAASTADELYEKQKDHAWGEIVEIYENPETGNVNAIWKPFPEYKNDVLEGKISPFTSPYIVNINGDFDSIEDGQLAHLHGVPNSGYPPEIASIKSVCIGGLQQCMTELKSVAAAGKLKQTFSNKPNTQNNTIMGDNAIQGQGNPNAPAQAGAQEGLTLEGVNAKVESLEQGFGEIQQNLQSVLAKIDALGGTKQPAPPVAAAGSDSGSAQVNQTGMQTQVVNEPDKVETITKELEAIKEERKLEKESLEKERSSMALEKRKQQVKEIVEAKLKLHRLKLEDKDTEFKRLLELKQEGSDEHVDLSILHEELTSEASSVSAAGDNYSQFTQYFGLTDNNDGDSNKNYYELSKEIGS